MVTVVFNPGDTSASKYSALSQYDYGQVLRIQGLNLPAAVEIDFALQPTGGTSVPRIGITKDGVTDVVIPDSMLENNDSTNDYSIYAFVFLTDETSGQTEYRITLGVTARPKPEVPGGTDNPDIFHEAVQAVREAAEQAAESEKQAEGWAHGREDLPERAEDNARYYAGQAQEDSRKTAEDRKEVERLVESVSGIDEQVSKVEELSKNAQEAATRAETSAEQGEIHKQAAENASTAAQTAAGKTAEDRAAVQKTKEAVEELSTQVQENKGSVDKTAQEFTLTAQQALADVNNTGQTQTDRVQTAGETAVRDIQTAQRTATGAVETAKTEAVKTIQAEGITQTGKVTAEGEKQVQAVQAAAQEIIADREQIQSNKTDIADLRQSKAGAIVETAKGSMVQIADSAEAFMEGLKIFGKSEQITTTGAQLYNMPEFADKNVDQVTLHKNKDGSLRLHGSTSGYCSFMIESKEFDLPNGTYYLACENSTNDNKVGIQLIGDVNTGMAAPVSKKTFEITDQNKETDIYIVINVSEKGWKGDTILYPLISKKNDSEWEPYTGGKPSPSPDYPQEIESIGKDGDIECTVSGKNLFDINKFQELSPDFYSVKNDIVYCLTNDNRGWPDVPTFMNLPKGRYVLSKETVKIINGDIWAEIQINDMDIVGIAESSDAFEFTIEESSKMKIKIFNDVKIMLCKKGNDLSVYEPYKQPQHFILQTPNGLPGIPVSSGGNYTDESGQQWVCDEIDLERGKYVQRIGVETKSGGWNLRETADIPERYIQPNILANKYKSADNISLCNIALHSSWGRPQPKKNVLALSGATIYIAPPKDMQITADEFNAILNNLDYPVVIAGQLVTPIETDLPPETIEAYKALRTYYPTTVVTNSANADMQLDYVADTQLYIKKELEKIVSTQIQKTANLLSLMPLSTQAAMIENDTNNILDNMEVEK